MRRIICILSISLTIIFTHCKKNDITANNNTLGGEKVEISLSVDENSKVDVNTATGEVSFATGDVVYVASHGQYIGTLVHDGTSFHGEITGPEEGQPLHFYFLGGKMPVESVGSTSLTVNISDQTTTLPVISYSSSREKYTTGVTHYTATLLNKCALVKFNVYSSAYSQPTCIKGMNNKVSINLITQEFTNQKDGDGVIKLQAGNGEKWAILLPQDAIASGEAFVEDGDYIGTYEAVDDIVENGYLTDGINVNIRPDQSLPGLLSISETEKVYFSKGNLYYDGTSFHFEDKQWDYRTYKGPSNGSACINGIYDYHGTPKNHYGLFGWSGSNYNNYGVSTETGAIYYQGTFVDWGNNIGNGWFTLNVSQWNYIVSGRPNASNLGKWITFDVVNGTVSGWILLPDDGNQTQLSSIENISDLATYNAVFLPAAGSRLGDEVSGVGISGGYWTSDRGGMGTESGKAYYYAFSSTSATYYLHGMARARSVRLVCR